jgi:hypothetical protein
MSDLAKAGSVRTRMCCHQSLVPGNADSDSKFTEEKRPEDSIQDEHLDGEKWELRCGKCAKIVSKMSVMALGRFFHPDCFACTLCNKNLANQPYTAWKSQPICAECFRELPYRVRRVINEFVREFKRQKEACQVQIG